MIVMLRSDNCPDVLVKQEQWEHCDLARLEQHIRTLQIARKWLIDQQAKCKEQSK